ncbi:hypothetical protein BT63DRAFT_426107 [Microthyrium microscopicum]|uniref:Uncharacterized protein n=1 Tax=Microthyrium microscopicum TaxID=703497 RepID=A0A6A6U997_9PEZI|nr:hypothetical protein BT63DRAFT_426107 [Microthyrium microscopicum]
MEKNDKSMTDLEAAQYDNSDVDSGEIKHEPGLGGWLRRVLLTVETKGIERVTDEDRKENTTKVWHACTFW